MIAIIIKESEKMNVYSKISHGIVQIVHGK
jgi:hypothetical protein